MNRDARNKALYLPAWLRPLAPHMATIALVIAALVLFALNSFFPNLMQQTRIAVTDGFSPVLNAMTVPAEAARESGLSWQEWTQARQENARLKDENAKLKTLIPLAQQYRAENIALRDLLKYKDDSVLSFLSARVIAQPSGNFTNSAIVTAGARDGVKKDMVALTEDGVVGRVIEVGEWSSRILLLEDLSFRIPVQLEDGQIRAILAGDGEGKPLRLLFVPKDIELKPGLRIATSGHGGIFPPHMPVGIIREVKKNEITVAPYARIDRLHIVRLARYDLAGGAQNAMNQNSATPLTQVVPQLTPQLPAPVAPVVAPATRPARVQ